MKDRLDTQRAKARSMMGDGGPRANLAMEMGGLNRPAPRKDMQGPADRYVRPGAPMVTERVAAYAKGGKVSRHADKKQDAAMMAQAMRKDEAADKKMVKTAVHKHERALHKGQPMTKLKHGGKAHYAEGGAVPRGKVGRYAAGGAAKVRQGHGQKVPKMPRGGNPVY